MNEYVRSVEVKAYDKMATMTPYEEFLPFDQHTFFCYIRNFSDKFLVDIFPFIYHEDLYTYIDALFKSEKYDVVNQIYIHHSFMRDILTCFYFDVFDLLNCSLDIQYHVYRTNTLLTPEDRDALSSIERILVMYDQIQCCEVVQQILTEYSRQHVYDVISMTFDGQIWQDAEE